jgi:hypothetical protein
MTMIGEPINIYPPTPVNQSISLVPSMGVPCDVERNSRNQASELVWSSPYRPRGEPVQIGRFLIAQSCFDPEA